MKSTALATRYAQALFDAADSDIQREDFHQQLDILTQAMDTNNDFVLFLLSRSIDTDEKKKLIKAVFGESFTPYIINFVFLVLDKNRESLLNEIIAAYDELFQASKGIKIAKLETASPIDDQIKDEISGQLKKSFANEDFVFDLSVDPSLLGGAKISIDDLVIDGTLKNQLKNLRRDLVKK